MSDIARLTVALYANSAQFVSELDRSNRRAKSWSDRVSSSFKTAAVASAAAATAATAALAVIYKQQASLIDQTAKFADRVGISTEALTQFRHAAELTGVGSKNLDMSLQRMTRRIAEAAQGSGEAAPALRALGLDAQALGNMTPDQQLYALADAFTDVESQSERVRLAFKLFDSEGVGMVNMLAGGADGLQSMADEADRLGITLSRVDAAKVEMANDAMYKINAATQGIYQSFTSQLAPIIAEMADGFLRYTQQFGGMNTIIAEGIHSTTQGVGLMADSLHGVEIIIKGLAVAWDGFKVGFMAAAQAVTTGLHQLGQFIFQLVISPLQVALDLAGNFSDEAANMAASLRQFSNMPPPQLFDASTVNQASLDLNNSLWELRTLASQPLPSDGIEQWYQDTMAKFNDLSKAYVESLNRNSGTGSGTGGAENKAVTSFREATNQIAQEWSRRQAIMAAGDQADYARESFAYADRQAQLSKQFQAAYTAAQANQQLQQQLEDEYFANRETLWQDHQSRITEIEINEAKKRQKFQQETAMDLLSFTEQQLSITTSALKDAGQESSLLYKTMFAVQKAAAIPSMIVSTEQAAVAAMAAFPGPAGLSLAAGVRALGYASVGVVAGQALSGMAHSGMDYIPREGTWLLDKGERVLTNSSARQMDEMYNAVTTGSGGGGGGATFEQHFHINGNGDETLRDLVRRAAEQGAQQGYERVARDFETGRGIRAQFKRSTGV
ncbi:hypothetical protein [Vibrio sp. H11]|uniref:hypothetical protein n=1 Tax=Vibrio sp. H11 TaxID=2565928 RepID=UPI0010A6A650|nr:hypothetical protein [Vibrio sp. H11]